MNKFDAIFTRLQNEQPSREIQVAVADLIAECLEQTKNSLGYWEKSCLTGAISALAWNLGSKHQPTDSWLRLSLVNAEKSLVPKTERDERCFREETINAFTYQQLLSSIQELQNIARYN